MPRLLALLPALLLASFAFALGNFDGAARAVHGAVAAGALLACAALSRDALGDPLRLGWRRSLGWLAPALLVAIVAASLGLSEVPRAGLLALVLLPAYLLIPAAVARVWRGAEERRIGLAAWSVATLSIAAWALLDAALRHADRTAAPLGHHNLLGVFLGVALPVALSGATRTGFERWLAVAAGVVGAAALAATRSLVALGAVALVGLVASIRLGRFRQLAAGLALLALGIGLPRIEAIARGKDRSALARLSYAEAAWSGARERPGFGWGPGSAPWTLSAFLVPRPGINPAGELVGEPHSTPLRIAYELGAAGLVAAAALVFFFFRARWRARREALDPALHLAGTAAVGVAVLASVGGSWLAVPALPLAIALAAGAALAAERAIAPAVERRATRIRSLVLAFYAIAALVVLRPVLLAQLASERAARTADPPTRDRLLAEAVERDPRFPLYRARQTWNGGDSLPVRVKGSIEAALAAKGVGPLWLKAGALALEAKQPKISIPALERAVALDPLSGTAPFLLFVASNGERLDCAARGFLGEPKLAAATWFRGHERERLRSLALAARWKGIEAGWGKELVREAAGALAPESEEVDLVQRIDAQPALSASLHLFRRTPEETELSRVRVDRVKATRINLPAATSLATSDRAAFPARGCSPG